jgi:hypothetical protein
VTCQSLVKGASGAALGSWAAAAQAEGTVVGWDVVGGGVGGRWE